MDTYYLGEQLEVVEREIEALDARYAGVGEEETLDYYLELEPLMARWHQLSDAIRALEAHLQASVSLIYLSTVNITLILRKGHD